MTVAEIDFRVGGRWRYAMAAEAGHEVAFNGEFREIEPDERIVYTEAFEGPWPEGDPAVNTATFTEAGGAHHAHPADRGGQQGGARRDPGNRHGDRHAGADGPARAARAVAGLTLTPPA